MRRQYVLVPRTGVRPTNDAERAMFLNVPITTSNSEPVEFALEAAANKQVTFIDSVHEDGPKLIEMEDDAERALNDRPSGFRAIEVVEYDRPNAAPVPDPISFQSSNAAASLAQSTVHVTDKVTGADLPDVKVVAFTNYNKRWGAQGWTDPFGMVKLPLSSPQIQRLYCFPPAGHWAGYRLSASANSQINVPLTPVDLGVDDCVRRFYPSSRFQPGTGVTVGVIDTGVGPHTDLNIVGGRNTVTGESSADHHDGSDHGTHVAGLVGANGSLPSGLRGMSPGISLRSYRVFGAGSSGATNYSILKAMIFAADDGCDILNLSLGGGPLDVIVEEAIQDARNQGMLVVIAAGNDGRRTVSYPARYPGATAVSAFGIEGTYPADTTPELDALRPPHATASPDEYIAAFSNVGPEIAVTGLGVGTLSTLPNNRYGPMSGTSMAAPVVAGAAASLLSNDRTIFAMNRDRSRSDAIERLLQSNCIRRGFGGSYEGYGTPDPQAV